LRRSEGGFTIIQTIVLVLAFTDKSAQTPKSNMSIDFQSIRQQVQQLGETAVQREQELGERRELALALLESNSEDLDGLKQRVQDVVRNHDPSLRCAMPVDEVLTTAAPLPALPDKMTVLAADGSQISPDRHAEVNYAVVNVGAIQMRRGSSEAPETSITSQLMYDEQLYSATGTISEASLALMRDREERLILGNLAEKAQPPVVAFTDGPMELWGGKGGGSEERADFQASLKLYLEALVRLEKLNVITGGYVDKPAANLLVRSLEVAMTPQAELADIKKLQPLRGVTDLSIFKELLAAGERSAVFAIQSQSAKSYQDGLKLHFFYLNVGRAERSYVARVEIPAWVAEDKENLDNLHAVLIEQCRVMGARPYPYLLHRAHETAVVKLPEKEQVTAMITQELRRRGLAVGDLSNKQSAKQAEGRGRYGR
jgi:hypothetical protein